MARKNLLHALLCVFGFLGAAFAQPPTDNLNGKTIHVYLPSDDWDTLWFENGDKPMKSDSKYWYSISLSGMDQYQQDFFFRTSEYRMKLGKDGFSDQEGTRIKVPDFQGKPEMWIIVDPSGPINAPPAILLEPPKIVNVLNPWPTTAPALVLAGGRKSMVTVPDRCGWFMAFLLKPGDTQFYLSEISNADTYGKGGYGSKEDFDLTAQFASLGSALWLDSDNNSWSGAWPGKDGDCQYLMAATVRDFSKDHPDFEFPGLQGDFLIKGMVQSTIGPDRKPVSTKIALPAPITYGTFDTWWNTDSTNSVPTLRSYESCVDIPMSKSSDGLWEYDSYRDSPKDHSFFPIDSASDHFRSEEVASCYVKPPPDSTSWVTNGPKRDGNFCMESHATFIYQKGQHFAFRGDDDVWVFINDKLVVDLGGVHTPKSDSVDLDKLGLAVGGSYKWDLFYCDRQPCGSSLRIKTSIFFKQQRALYGIESPGSAPGSVIFEIWKRTGGNGSCASIGTSTDSVKASHLTYQLLDANGTLVKPLGDGSFYGGIVIATPDVSVDTAKVTGLAPGLYRIVAFEPANEKVRAEIPFRVPARNLVEFEPPYAVTVPVGTVVRVVAANRENGALVAKAGSYTLIVPAGLQVFADAGRSLPVASGSVLKTDSTGFGSLFATVDSSDPSDKTYSLAIAGSARKMTLTFRMPPLILPKLVSASIYDDDGDGIADRIAAVFDRDITASLPSRIAYRWPAAAAESALSGADVPTPIAGGTTLELKGKLTAEVLTQGAGAFSASFAARKKDSVQTVTLADRIGPIILSATLALGKAQDSLALVFSEPIAGGLAADPAALFAYKRTQASDPVHFNPAGSAWSGGYTQVTLFFPSASAGEPHAGDLVRIEDGPGLIADAAGNTAGPQSRFRVITGGKRSEIATVTFREIDPQAVNTPPVEASLQSVDAKIADVVESTGRIGHLIKTDLGAYAVKDDFSNVDPAQVVLEYTSSYFTNLGVSVAEDKRSVPCTDAIYGGDCLAHRGYLFVGWNYIAKDGSKAATGAYVARIRYQIRVAGKIVERGGLDQIWGILRRR